MILRRAPLTSLALLLSSSAFAAASAPVGLDFIEERFRQLDRNHDGKLTREEAAGAPWFDRVDRRGTGVVTLEEIQAIARRFGADREIATGNSPANATAGVAVAPESPREAPKILKPGERGVGRLIADLSFTDITGATGRFSEYRSAKALVIALTGTSCPLAKKYLPSLARLEKEFAAKGVAFLYVDPTATDTPAELRAAAQENGVKGRTVHDRDAQLVAALGAQTTTEVFILDAARTLVFRGAVDDQYGLGYSLDAPRATYLRDALDAILSGRRPAIAATEAPGCALDYTAPAAGAGTVTYHNRISRIIQNNCLECHRPGGVGPFSLATYDDVRSHAGMIRKQVGRGAMPPWFAAPPAAGESSHWKNDRSLSPADKTDLLAWIAGEKTVGDPADAPLPRTFPVGWTIEKPDAVIELPNAVAIKASGVMPYQTFRVATHFNEDKWVRAYEVQPTDRGVVHHVIVKVYPPGAKAGASGNERDAAGEREGFFAAYVPGNNHAIFPPGFAKKIPAGATVVFQIHYTPNGKATTDRTRLGLVFASEPPRHVIHVTGIANPRLQIPAGDANHPETASITVPTEVTLLSFAPHMHVRGKAARYEAVLPDGTRQTLLDVPAYDFNWQLQYQLATPLTLPRGTRVIYTAWYDNSSGNPANPDPTKTVRWGPQTFDEMMLGYVEYYIPGQTVLAQVERGFGNRR